MDPVKTASGTYEFKRGWPLLFAAAIAGIPVAAPIYLVGVFVPKWEAEFGWNRLEIATSLSVYTAVIAITAPIIGAMVDRFGVRRLVLGSLFLLGAGFFAVSRITANVFTLYTAYAFCAFVGSAGTGVPFSRLVVLNFDAGRGLALSLSQFGTPLSLFLVPMLSYVLLQHMGWRDAWQFLSLIPLICCFIVFAFLTESTGPSKATGGPRSDTEITGIPFKEAIRMPRFWRIAISFFLFFFTVIGAVGQMIPILKDMGLSEKDAVFYQSIMGVAIVVGRLSSGYIMDRFPVTHIYTVMCLIGALGFAALSLRITSAALFLTLSVGLIVGSEFGLLGYMISRYFGLRNYGKIFGAAYGLFMSAGICAPIVIGHLFDVTKGYAVGGALSAVVVGVAGLLLFRLGPYPTFDQSPEDRSRDPAASGMLARQARQRA